MQIEIDDNSHSVLMVFVIMLTVATTVALLCYYDFRIKEAYARAGLVQKQMVGSQNTIWTKP